MKTRFLVLITLVFAIRLAAPATMSAQQPTPAAQTPPSLPTTLVPQPTPPAPAAQKPTPPAPAAQKPTPPPAPAAPPPVSNRTNVRIDVTIVDQAANAPAIKKIMSLVASRNGSVRSGVNVPTIQTTYGAVASGGINTIPITSYSYRTMGLNLDVRDVFVSPTSGLVGLSLSIEYNPIDEAVEKSASPSNPAAFSNFSQSFTLELENGKPLMVAQTSDPVPSRNRTLSVEVKATILK